MNSSGLIKLLVAVVVVGGLALVVLESETGERVDREREPLYPALDERINDVATIQVRSTDATFSVRRNEDGEWVAEDWGGFPVAFENVKKTIVGLSDLEVMEAKTAKPARWEKLGVEDPTDAEAESMGVRVLDGTGEVLADVVVGDRRQGASDALYVRRAGEDQSWLVKGTLRPPRQLDGWVDRELLRIPAARVERVVLRHPDGDEVVLRKTGERSWDVSPIPDGHQVKTGAPSASVGGALAYLDLESVVPSDEVDVPDDAWSQARYETEEGTAIVVSTAEVDGTHYARFAFERLPEIEGPEAPDPGEEDDTPEDEAVAAVEEEDEDAIDPDEEVVELAERLSPWTFTLSQWKAETLRKRRDDFVEAIPAEEDGGGDESGPDADEREGDEPAADEPGAEPAAAGPDAADAGAPGAVPASDDEEAAATGDGAAAGDGAPASDGDDPATGG